MPAASRRHGPLKKESTTHSKAVGHAKTGGFAFRSPSSILGVERRTIEPTTQRRNPLAVVRPKKDTLRRLALKRRFCDNRTKLGPPAASRRRGPSNVKDDAGQKLAYVYFEEEPGRRSSAKLLTKDEAGSQQISPSCRSYCDRPFGLDALGD
jgi:hypothetical protein